MYVYVLRCREKRERERDSLVFRVLVKKETVFSFLEEKKDSISLLIISLLLLLVVVVAFYS